MWARRTKATTPSVARACCQAGGEARVEAGGEARASARGEPSQQASKPRWRAIGALASDRRSREAAKGARTKEPSQMAPCTHLAPAEHRGESKEGAVDRNALDLPVELGREIEVQIDDDPLALDL